MITSFHRMREEKIRDHLSTNQNAATLKIECNDRECAKIVKLITNCQLREFAINPFSNNNNSFHMTNINLKN